MRYTVRFMSSPRFAIFYSLIRQIPPGRVATYGQVARCAGHPRHARHVGQSLRALSADDGAVPWHRVVNSQGRISPRGIDGTDDLQYRLLEAEGVQFDATGRIDLARFGWKPPQGPD